MKCKHYKGDGYGYKISANEELNLCDQCHLNLAGQIMKQLCDEVFIDSAIKRLK